MAWYDVPLGIGTGGLYTAAKAAYDASGIGNGAPQVAAPDKSLYNYGDGGSAAANSMRNNALIDQVNIDKRAGYGLDLGQYNQQYGFGNQDRGAQNSLLGQYQDFLRAGPGPSVAQAQMQQGEAMAARNAMNMAANAGPNQAGLGLRAAMQANQAGGLAAAGQGAIGAMQEQRDWRGQQLGALQGAGGLAGAMRGQDYGAAGQALGAQQMGMDNYYGNRNANDARYQQSWNNLLGTNAAEQQANQAYGNAQMGAATQNAQADQAQRQQNMALVGAGLGAAGQGLSTMYGKKLAHPMARYDAFDPHPDYPGALLFRDTETGETLPAPLDVPAVQMHAARINVANGEHPLAGLHPDYPHGLNARERGYLAGERQGERDAMLAGPGGTGIPRGGMAGTAGPPPQEIAPPGVAPEPPPAAPVEPPAATGAVSFVPTAAPPAGMSTTPPGPSDTVARLSADAARAHTEAARTAEMGTYVAPSKGGKIQTAEQRQGLTPMSPEERAAYEGAEAAARASKQQLAMAEADNAARLNQRVALGGHFYDEQSNLVRSNGTLNADAVLAKQRAVADELRGDKVEPGHYLNSMSSGHQAIAAIALALGAIGGGLMKDGRNRAAEALNQAIDRDIDAQKSNIAKKQGELSHYGQLYQETLAATGNHVAALAAAKVQYLEDVTRQAQALATSTGSPVMMARAQALADENAAEQARLKYKIDREELGQTSQNYAVRQSTKGGYARATAAQLATAAGERDKATAAAQAGEKAGIERGQYGIEATKANAEAAKGQGGSLTLSMGQSLPLRAGLAPDMLSAAHKQVNAAAIARSALARLTDTSGNPLTPAERQSVVDQYTRAAAVAGGQGQASEGDLKAGREKLGGYLNPHVIEAEGAFLDSIDHTIAQQYGKR